MTAAELSALSDQQLSERVAVEVAGFEPGWSGTGMRSGPDGWRRRNSDGIWEFTLELPSFATSADAVLPLLIARGQFNIDDPTLNGKPAVRVMLNGRDHVEVVAKTLARAACFALLLAKGAA